MPGRSKWGDFRPDPRGGYLICVRGGPEGRAAWVPLTEEIWFAANTAVGPEPVAAFITGAKAREYAERRYSTEMGLDEHGVLVRQETFSWTPITRDEDGPEISDRQKLAVWDPRDSELVARGRFSMPGFWEVWRVRLAPEGPEQEVPPGDVTMPPDEHQRPGPLEGVLIFDGVLTNEFMLELARDMGFTTVLYTNTNLAAGQRYAPWGAFRSREHAENFAATQYALHAKAEGFDTDSYRYSWREMSDGHELIVWDGISVGPLGKEPPPMNGGWAIKPIPPKED